LAADAGEMTSGGPVRAIAALVAALLVGWWVSAGAPLWK
jgi:hypothetical protein